MGFMEVNTIDQTSEGQRAPRPEVWTVVEDVVSSPCFALRSFTSFCALTRRDSHHLNPHDSSIAEESKWMGGSSLIYWSATPVSVLYTLSSTSYSNRHTYNRTP